MRDARVYECNTCSAQVVVHPSQLPKKGSIPILCNDCKAKKYYEHNK